MTIYMTAKFEVKQEALKLCKQAIQEFIDAVRADEPSHSHCPVSTSQVVKI
jgi:hypothetical protein